MVVHNVYNNLPFKHAVATSCTSCGFMELDLLRKRAEKISGGVTGAGGGLDEEFRLLTNASFSCNGTMTGLLLVGAVRTNEDEYPKIQIWRNTNGNTYTRQDSEDIGLDPGDFSPDGVLQYNLTTPISFQSGDVLAVNQPKQGDSVLRVYYDDDSSASTVTYKFKVGKNERAPTSSVSLSRLTMINNESILISPISG